MKEEISFVVIPSWDFFVERRKNMKNQCSENKTRLLIAIISTILGVLGILLPYIFKENLGSFLNYFLTILGAIIR